MSGPLSHIRVLDLSRVLAGPWASQNLADLGAGVIKVERPGSGDDTRSWGPPFLRDDKGAPTNESAYYLATNRGKKSVAIDMSKSEGADLIRALAGHSDILIENFKVGGLAKYGLAYDDLKEANPGLIYCSITGFGQTGPYSGQPGYDFIIQAMGGMMSVTGERDDLPGGGPQKVGIAIADIMTGMYASIAVLAALAHRDRTGEGQHIDLALLDCLVSSMATQNMNYLVSGEVPVRQGNAHANITPYQIFATADEDIVVASGNDAQFSRLCEVAGCPELAADDRFSTNAARIENREALISQLSDILITRPGTEWIDALNRVNVPAGPVNRLDAVFADAQVQNRALLKDLAHPLAGTVPQVVGPLKFSRTKHENFMAPPTLGQHTDAVLGEILELEPSDLARLREAGVIA